MPDHLRRMRENRATAATGRSLDELAQWPIGALYALVHGAAGEVVALTEPPAGAEGEPGGRVAVKFPGNRDNVGSPRLAAPSGMKLRPFVLLSRSLSLPGRLPRLVPPPHRAAAAAVRLRARRARLLDGPERHRAQRREVDARAGGRTLFGLWCRG